MKIKKFFGKEKTSKTFINTKLSQLSLSELSHVSGAPGTGQSAGSGGGGRSLH